MERTGRAGGVVRQLLAIFVLSLLAGTVHATDHGLVQLEPFARDIRLTSFTRPIKSMVVAAEVGGKFRRVVVDVGDTVSPGGLVAELDDTFIKLDIEQNRISQLRVKKQLELEQKNLRRIDNLLTRQSTSQAAHDEAVAKVDVLQLSLDGLRNEARNLREKLKRHRLYGPPGYQVIQRLIEPGEYLRQGEPVVKLGDFRSMKLPFLLTITELHLLEEMPSLKIDIEDLGKPVESEIHIIAPDFDEKRRKIQVWLKITKEVVDSTPELRGGMRAMLTISGKIERNSYRIPSSAVLERYGAHWILSSQEKRVKVLLLGRDDGDRIAIIHGEQLSGEEHYFLHPEKRLAGDRNEK